MARRIAPRQREAASPVVNTRSWLSMLGVGLVCAKVALIPVVFDYGADLPFTLPKVLLSHALSYAILGVLIADLIKSGRRFLRWSPLHLPVLAFLVVSTVASVVAADPLLALFGTHGRMLGLGTIADGVVRGSRGCRHKRPRSIGGGAWIRTGSIARARSRRLERKRSGSAVFDDRSDNNTCRVPGRTGDRHSRGRRVCPRATPTSARGACHLRRILDRWDGRDSDAGRPHRSCRRDRSAHSSHLGCAPE